jgi:omega-amidase
MPVITGTLGCRFLYPYSYLYAMASLTVSLIQSKLFWEDKQANLNMFAEKIRSIEARTELIVLPEMFSTGFSMNAVDLAEDMNGETMTWMQQMAAEKNSIITGSFICKTVDETTATPPRYTNRLVWMLPNGQYGCYDKRHLFGYAGEDQYYSAGEKRFIASVKGWKVNTLVCYDLRFPVWARQQLQDGQPEFDLLVYVANWPEKRIQAWKTLLQARAIENQCYVVGVNRVGEDGKDIHYTGESMIIDPLGEILFTKKDDECVETMTLDKSKLDTVRERFPFWKDGDEAKIMI